MAKAGGHYASSYLIKREARRNGFDEAIALAPDGTVSEGSGQIIDATVVPAPRQRNTEDEKAAIKQGKIRQKDRDARWSLKYSKAKVKEGADPTAFKPVGRSLLA